MGRDPGISSPRLGPLVERIAGHPTLGAELVHSVLLPAEPARFAALDPPLPAPLAGALAASGADRLWSHQAAGLAAARRGEDVLVTTPTASGKSLVFQLPVLEEACRGGAGRALFLFPLKALGQDQKAKLEALAAAAGLDPAAAGCAIYDGDTPRAERAAIKRDLPRVVVSNPDMLHFGLLGSPEGWGELLATLRWVVLDELHTYRGIFGSHFHHVLARFLRLCRAAGSSPSLIASSATAGNAVEFAEALTGRRFRWVGESGAPREGRHLLLFQPATSPYTTALRLFATLLDAGLKTIVFTKARRITELLYSWLRRQRPELARRVASYRAGFLPDERRGIERDLFTGRLDGVISTSALEMGIDVGGLDACILVGYPGSVMSTWQRSGRVGRAGRESITALVALPDALDQFLLAHPEELLGRPCERLVVDPANAPVARAHLVCAATERPLSESADAPYLERHRATVEALVGEAALFRSADGETVCSLRRRPHREVALRGGGETWRVVAGASADGGGRGRTVGTVDGVRALHECHPGAVYLHAGRQYLIEELDFDNRRATARAADELDYYTAPLTEKQTEVLEVEAERRDGPLQAWLGRVRVTEWVVGYERKRIHGRETLDRRPLELPPTRFETVALWWAAPPAVEAAIRGRGEHFMGALHAAEHAAISLFPLLAICDRGDIGGISYPFHPQVGAGAVFVYDGHPGGVGIAARGFEELPALLARVAERVAACGCEDGCPSCVQSPKCGNGNRPLDKAGAARLARLLLGAEPADGAVEPLTLDLGATVEPRSRRRPVEAPGSADSEGASEEERGGEETGSGGEASRNGDAGERLGRLEEEMGGGEISAGPVASRASDAGEGLGRPEEELGGVTEGPRAVAGAGRRAWAGRSAAHSENGWARRVGGLVQRLAGLESSLSSAPASQISTDSRPATPPGPSPGPRPARRDPRPPAPGSPAPGSPAPGSPAPGSPAPGSPAPRSPPSSFSFSPSSSSSSSSLRRWLAAGVARLLRRLGPPPPAVRPGGGTLVFDLETLRSAAEVGGWGNAHRMGLAVAVVCHLEEGRFEVFGEGEIHRLVAALEAASLVIGFNVKRFDYRVLGGYTGIDHARRIRTLDLLEEIHRTLGFRIGLDALARATLGTGKTADGLQSLRWVAEGRLDLVAEYCRHDVEVLRDLYLHGRREGHVVFPARRGGGPLRLPVAW